MIKDSHRIIEFFCYIFCRRFGIPPPSGKKFWMRALDVLHFFKWQEVLDAHALSGHSAKHQNPILHAVSPVSQNLPVESLNQYYIFLAKKYASFGHSAYFPFHYGKLSHLIAKYDKSTPNFVDFHCAATQIPSNVLIWSYTLSNYKMMSFYWYVLCICTLLLLVCWWRHVYGMQEKKEEIRLSHMTKAPTPTEKSKKQHDNTKRHQKLRLHNDSGPTSDGQLE